MRNRPLLFATAAITILAGACGVGGRDMPDTPAPAVNEWRFSTDEHIALWYHGLAVAGVGVEAGAPVPFYRPGYQGEADAARRRLGRGTSPFATNPGTLGSRLASAGVADGLQFLPLYFESWTQLTQSVEVWRQAAGDPARASSQEAAAVIAFLSNMFPSATQRGAVVEWVAALEAERTAFFAAWWNETQPTALAQEVETTWRALQPRLIAFLRYSNAANGRISLTPALGGEGRMESGRGIAVGAIGGRTGDDAQAIVGRVIHELSYALAAEAVRDAVAPARIREIGEDVLVARAAVRAGALVIEEIAPELLPAYRDYYLRAAGAPGTGTTLIQRYPLPDELVEPLGSSVRLAVAGI